MILGINGILAGKGADADALAFITAANITDTTQKSAVTQLVTDLKSANIWTKMKAIYPFVGGTASSHRFNLKDPRDLDVAFRLVFNGGWTHSSTGALPNSSNGYVNTFLNTSIVLTPNNLSIGLYTNTDRPIGTQSRIAYGNSDNLTTYIPLTQFYLRGPSDVFISDLGNGNFGRVSGTNTTTAGFYVNTRTANNLMKVFKNNTLIGSSTITNPTNTLPNSYLYFAAFNNAGAYADGYESVNYQFAYVSDGLSDTESANFYTAVQKFQTTLGRQVGVPIVADSDAQAFLNAAVITDTTQANAINTLVTDLKSANIWSKMKAIYPFVGGTASSHRFNLKAPTTNASDFYLTFNGGWTHSSTGAKPNGINAYAETNFVVKNHMDYTSLLHFSYYSRTNTTLSTNPPYRYDMGVENYNGATYIAGAGLNIRRSDNSTFWSSVFGLNTTYNFSGSTNTANSLGLFVGNTTATNTKIVKNNTTLIQNQGASSASYDLMNSLATSSVWIGTLNEPNYVAQNRFTDKEAAFISIGWGFTDAELTSLYNAVNAYQVALSRNV